MQAARPPVLRCAPAAAAHQPSFSKRKYGSCRNFTTEAATTAPSMTTVTAYTNSMMSLASAAACQRGGRGGGWGGGRAAMRATNVGAWGTARGYGAAAPGHVPAARRCSAAAPLTRVAGILHAQAHDALPQLLRPGAAEVQRVITIQGGVPSVCQRRQERGHVAVQGRPAGLPWAGLPQGPLQAGQPWQRRRRRQGRVTCALGAALGFSGDSMMPLVQARPPARPVGGRTVLPSPAAAATGLCAARAP